MSWGTCRNRWCAMRFMVTALRERRPTEIVSPPDAASQASPESALTCSNTVATLARMPRGLGRVLVVDDDEVIRRLIAANLTLEGFDVAMAVDGQDCLDNVSAIAPDIITLDVMTPRLGGWETAIRLRKSPDTSHIKVVLITARAQEDDQTPDTHRGADAYVTKPFDPGELIKAIRKLAGAPAVTFT
jgi:CheY-like chemotaxis protein